jgi:hypothetical protein
MSPCACWSPVRVSPCLLWALCPTATALSATLAEMPRYAPNFAVSRQSLYYVSHGSPVGIATGYELDDRGIGVRVPVRYKIFIFPYRPDLLWGPSNLLSHIYVGGSFRGVKRPGREADNLYLMPRSSKHGSIHPLLDAPSWRGAQISTETVPTVM